MYLAVQRLPIRNVRLFHRIYSKDKANNGDHARGENLEPTRRQRQAPQELDELRGLADCRIAGSSRHSANARKFQRPALCAAAAWRDEQQPLQSEVASRQPAAARLCRFHLVSESHRSSDCGADHIFPTFGASSPLQQQKG
ncbi:hypothetical protein cyc_05903 [Cyclospora cayetanensis]|uniref:Uncharacterized protein n=1 Tax=Cyclospora cayetanensis TaxID=88456 RepID=A0A1D3D7A1_9EIME|nr:hypothetical protein cyc_05903 [Cyclospora cayetanensis]